METTATALLINETENGTIETVLDEIALNNGKPYEFQKHLEGYIPLTQEEINAYANRNNHNKSNKRFGRHFTTPPKQFATMREMA